MTENGLSLESLAHGAAVEIFNEELQRVLDNIQDPNTNAMATRKVTLTVEIKPNSERTFAEGVKVQCVSKLAANAPITTHLFLGRNSKGGGIASEFYNNQTSFLTTEKKAENVIPIKQEVK